MAKKLQKIELNIVGTPNPDGTWLVKASADLTVGLDEYPDWDTIRKGIAITLTPTQETTIKNFVNNVVLPQAEVAK